MSGCEYDPSEEHSTTDADGRGADDTAHDGTADGDAERETFSAATLERMQGFIDDHGYLSWLGIELVSASPGRAVMTLSYREELTNPGSQDVPRTHGGIPATLIDTASGFALRTTFDDPARAALTTTDLDVSYLRPATADLRVECEVVRAGGSIGVTRASVTSVAPDGDRKEIAIGTTTYRLFRGRDRDETDEPGDADRDDSGETGHGDAAGDDRR